MGVATTTGTLTALMKTYYDKLLLEVARPKMVLDQFADKSRDIPRHEGQTVSFQRFVPLEVVTATTNEGELPPYVELEAMRFEATLQKYANAVRITEEVELTALSPVLEAAVKELGENMGQSLNRLYRGALAKFLYPMRVDNSPIYGKSCVATAGTTTTLTDATNLTEADDFWNGGTVVITSGQNKGYSAHIDDFDSGVITFSPALKEACDKGDTFRVVTSTGITSTNVITCSAVERAVALLKYFNAPTYDGKYYIGIISPFVQYDFMQDSAWVNAHHYAQDTALFDGEVGRWGGVRWVEDTDPWLEAAGTIGTYNANGAVHQTPIFGRHSYAGVGIEEVPDKLFIKKPGDQDTSNYINAYSMVAWRVYFVPVVLNALFGVTLVSGASTIA